jgi:hypothetical protein
MLFQHEKDKLTIVQLKIPTTAIQYEMMVSDIGGDASIGSTSLSTRLTMVQDDDLEEGDVLVTPGSEKNRWAAPETPSAANRAKRTKGNGTGVTLTLRDQEKVCNLHLPPLFI